MKAIRNQRQPVRYCYRRFAHGQTRQANVYRFVTVVCLECGTEQNAAIPVEFTDAVQCGVCKENACVVPVGSSGSLGFCVNPVADD